MFEVKRYTADYKSDWDAFIQNSKNGTFLFLRDYMDYHSDRFIESSFMFYKKGKLEAVIPGNVLDKTFYSHQGLTYGGLIQSVKLSTIEVLTIFSLLNQRLKEKGIEKVIYKSLPHIYHKIPAQEDIYALYKNGAVKIGCNISSAINQNNKIRFNELRRRGMRKSCNAGVVISETDRFDLFWPILNHNLEVKYGRNAVHTLDEIILLQQKFPNNIKLYIAVLHDEVIAGSVLYLSENVIHAQSISSSEIGKSVGALDLLFHHLINDSLFHQEFFDFGQSTENMGEYLNENLLFQKESFGARGVVYEIYQYDL